MKTYVHWVYLVQNVLCYLRSEDLRISSTSGKFSAKISWNIPPQTHPPTPAAAIL